MEVTLIVFRLLNSLVGVWEIGQSCSRITFRYEDEISKGAPSGVGFECPPQTLRKGAPFYG